uniref:Type II secretion system protein GspE N-terminal domain-containing protein n=1 Tax=Thermosporothrix sp. COM3 TaxID=2490863 RepID=A0A455SJK0_9CHLR|nr:hypothetical protein KTC_33780 [Thermosporothrix sp. COM3]
MFVYFWSGGKQSRKMVHMRVKSKALPKPVTRPAVIPGLRDLRHIPHRYRRLLPLQVMQKYQCAVIGKEGKLLTVAVVAQPKVDLYGFIYRLTGCAPFFVLIDPFRMHLLLQRVERFERQRTRLVDPYSPYHPLRVRPLFSLLPCHLSK